jgi:polar amino acid transport system substrate-binding protein
MPITPSPRKLCARIGAVLFLSIASSGFALTEIRTVAQEATEPKFVVLKQSGKTSVGGLCIDIMRAIERVAPDLKFVGDQNWEPLVRVEAGVANNTLDAACGFLRNSLREAKFNYIEPALFPVHYYLAVRIDDNVQVNNWDDVRKLGDQGTILVINGFGMIKRLNDIGGLKVDSGANDSKTNLEKLVAGRGRFYIHRVPGMLTEISKAGMQGKVKLLSTPIHSEKFHMVVSRELPMDTVEKIRRAIALLEKTGELKKMLEKWENY